MADEYWLIGGDGKEYGPVTLATLTQWIEERRVVAASRVRRGAGPFMEAGRLPEIAGLFPSQVGTWLPPTPGVPTEAVAPSVAVQLPAEFRVWQLFGLAWTLVKRSWLPLGAMFCIMALIMAVPILGCVLLFVLGGPILVGVSRAILGMIGGRRPTVGMMFEGFDRFGDAFLAFLVSSILIAIGGILIVPAIILAVALYYLLAPWGMVSSRFALGLGHTVLATPFVVVTVGAALRRFDRSLELAALGLGASWLTMMRRVLLPAIAPGVIASAVFAFVTSFDDVVLALFLTNVRSRTLPKLMYEGVAHEIDPTITAVAVLLVLFTALILAVDLVLERRRR